MDREIERRRFLELAAATTTLPLAGCALFRDGDQQADGGTVSTPTTPTQPGTPDGGNTGTPRETSSPSIRRVTWGESITTPQGLELTVSGGSFAETYSGAGTNRSITPPADRKFVLILAQVHNPTAETISLPSLGYFHVRVNETTYDVLLGDPSMQVPVGGGTTRQIQLPFLVPASTEASGVAVLWVPVYENGRIAVLWERG